MAPIEHVEFLSRSEHRASILRQLTESGPTTRREFREELSASRSTVTRSLSALEERGWIREDGERYQLTVAGREITERFLALAETIELTEELSPFLDWFPESELPFPLDRLSDATITVSTHSDPYAPARRHAAVFEEMESFSGVLPSVDVEVVRTFRNQLHERELTAEIIVTPGIEDRFRGSEYEALVRDLLAHDGLRMFVSQREVSYYLGIADDEVVQIGVEDDQGRPQTLVETTDQVVREWAEEEYGAHRSAARTIENF